MPDKQLLSLLILTGTFSIVNSGRILAFLPVAFKSHQRFIQPLIRELAVRGHQVVLYTSYLAIDDVPENLEVVKLMDYMPTYKKKTKMDTTKRSTEVFNGKDNLWTAMTTSTFMYNKMLLQFVEVTLQEEVVQELIKSDQKFDAVILEDIGQETFIAFGHKFNAPTVMSLPSSNSLWSHYIHGTPYDTSYIAECLHELTDQMNLEERMFNTFMSWWRRIIVSFYFMPKYQSLMYQYIRYPGWEMRPSMLNMVANASLLLINTDVATNYPYPYAPHVKEVGGLHLQTSKPLPKALQTFMDESKEGVIYFALGSTVDTSVRFGNVQGILRNVFKQLKQRVILKWETNFPNIPDNVKVGKWFPQQDILHHNNCVLYITHGGQLSITESINAGVPVLGIPLFGDQMRNVKHAEHFGYGLSLKVYNMTEGTLISSINEIISNPIYKINAKKRSALFRDKPKTALETATYWTEYVLKHKGAHHLKPATVNMPWYQHAMIDVYTAFAVAILVLIYVVCKIVCYVITIIKGRNKRKNEKAKEN